MTAVGAPAARPDAGADPKRWLTLGLVITSVFILTLDNTVLNVAIPTIMREFDTDLPTVQWVISGYALTFASLLIIGGRLGDLYGQRRTFTAGAILFGIGSAIASFSTSVPVLVIGEAVIEGMGAALMGPATLAILSTTFRGQERATAFAAWGAVAGAGVAFGPLLGGFLTTHYSWRWSFRINVCVAILAIAGAVLFMRRDAPRPPGRRARIDVPGAVVGSAGTFLLVFALSSGARYGWLSPQEPFSLFGWTWPEGLPFSVVPVALALSAACLTAFWAIERSKERRDASPLFELGLLRHPRFRYGLMTTAVLATGQFALIFVLPVFLQDGKHLTAMETGIWLVPQGVSIVIGSQIGSRLTRRVDITTVVRAGLVVQAVGLFGVALAIGPGTSFWSLLPGSFLFGVGVGAASSQLTSTLLADVPADKSGVAGGANTTVRQVGAAMGIAVMGSLLSALTIRHATGAVTSSDLPAPLQATVVEELTSKGVNFTLPPGVSPADLEVINRALVEATTAGARPALFFAAGVVVVGAVLSWRIPRTGTHVAGPAGEPVDGFEGVEPVAVDPALVVGRPSGGERGT